MCTCVDTGNNRSRKRAVPAGLEDILEDSGPGGGGRKSDPEGGVGGNDTRPATVSSSPPYKRRSSGEALLGANHMKDAK